LETPLSESANEQGVIECRGGRLEALELVLCLDSTPMSVFELFDRKCLSEAVFNGEDNSLIGLSKSLSRDSSGFSDDSSTVGVSECSKKLAGKRVYVSRVEIGDICAENIFELN
jgi:hypothetical protein